LAVIAALTELSQFAQFLVGSRCDVVNPILGRLFGNVLGDNPVCFSVSTSLLQGCWWMFCSCVLYIIVGQIVISLCLHVLDARDQDPSVPGALHWKTRFMLRFRLVAME